MRNGFSSAQSPDHKGVTDTWFTPIWLVSQLGSFDLDPCTQSFRPFDTALNHYCEDLGQDGLALPWSGRVWLNPPYGLATGRWLAKLAGHGDGIALVFSRTETRWAQTHLKAADAVLFLAGRVSFIRADQSPSTNAANGSMLLAYGADNVASLDHLDGVKFCKK